LADSKQLRLVLGSRRSELFTSDGDWEQFQVYLDAFDLYLERNGRYADLWREYGARDTAHHCRSKVLRMERELSKELTPEDYDLDDAHDLINYSAFTIRNVGEGNIGHA
jgi:hypothetical protein